MTAIVLSSRRHRLLTDHLAERAEPAACGGHFLVYHMDLDRPPNAAAIDPDDIILVHDFQPSEIDNNVAHHVAEDLLPLLTGQAGIALREQQVFEHFVGAIVRSMDGSERRAWHRFYDNTLRALARPPAMGNGTGPGTGGEAPGDFISDFAAIYRRVTELAAEVVPATLFDAATCFGFLPLLLGSGAAGMPLALRRVVACDRNPYLVALAEGYAREWRRDHVRFVQADILGSRLAETLGAAAGDFDVVTAIHLLEHLEPAETGPALGALWSLTRRRLIVTVPMEPVPDPRFGHRQTFDRARLAALGSKFSGAWCCFEHHGAWLVIDRIAGRPARGEGTR